MERKFWDWVMSALLFNGLAKEEERIRKDWEEVTVVGKSNNKK